MALQGRKRAVRQRETGFREEAITAVLVRAGATKEDIDRIFAEAERRASALD